jgi:hypothetical protein
MPYRVDPKNKKCVQVKKSGNWQRKGCTNGPVKNYLAALYANTKDIKESEDLDWAFNLTKKIESNLEILGFTGKEVMIDVRGMTYKEKENLLEVIRPYLNENTKSSMRTSEPSGNDWTPKCLLSKTRVKTFSLHCATEDTDYIPEEGNVCCLSTTYEEEELTPKDLLISVNGKDLLKTNLNENEEWWTDTVNSFGTTESDVYYNEISDLLKGTPYEIVVEGMSFGNGKFFKIKHRDNVLSLDTWSERFFKPKDIWEDIVSQISYFNSNHEKLKGLYILLIPFFRKHGIKPGVLDESEEFDWAKDLITNISNNTPNGKVLVTIDNWEKFRNVPVTRGPDWEYGSQDKGGSGFIEEISENDIAENTWVSVVWKNSSRNTYRIGPANHDLYFNFNLIEGKNKSKNLLTEGRFDKVTSSVVKDVMRYVNYLMDKKNIENTYNVRLPLEDDYYQEGDITFNVELDIMFQEMDGGFELRSNIIGYDDVDDDVDDDDYYDDENHDIGLQLYLNKTKGKTFYQQLYYKLIEDIRHEIEHLSQFDDISKKGEGARPTPIDYDQFEDVFSHHTDPAEIEALTQGFYIRAKKEKKPLDTVILDYLNSIEEKKAITPKQKTEILKNLLNYAKKNLPKAIYQQD